jgi:16S rRNA (cytidine1402-2'-O)-methyltransferase
MKQRSSTYSGVPLAGKLILLPNVLDESLPHEPFLPASVAKAVGELQGLIAESEKAARRYLRRFLSHDQMAAMPLRLLNEHTDPKECATLLEPVLRGEIWGVISDAGLPCIADPGADLVWRAQQAKVQLEAIAGPTSLLLALQLSGFSGQRFAFHGYLPREEGPLTEAIKTLERNAKGNTQIWIEAPYRSGKMLEALKRSLGADTLLCLAVQLTAPDQRVVSQSIQKWKAMDFPLGKEPAVFLLYRY